jgi:NAD(P)-dependent dehydrogenase (short-subunit alcohol dehydrogenase family)
MIVVITGASKGIGREICKHLIKQKHSVINLSRTKCTIKKVKNYRCEISDYSEVKKVFKKIKKLDVLINNSGIGEFNNNDIETFDKILKVNLNGAFYCSYEASKILKKKKLGSIINICSINAYQAFPDNPGYVSSKGGLLSLTKSFALDLSKYKIRVNSVSPGYIRTDMTRKSYLSKKENKKRLDRMMIKRWGEPKDLLGIIDYLTSKSSSYSTGQDYVVDGGWISKGL